MQSVTVLQEVAAPATFGATLGTWATVAAVTLTVQFPFAVLPCESVTRTLADFVPVVENVFETVLLSPETSPDQL